MKALLMKDLHVFWRRMKIILLMLVVFSAMPSEFQCAFATTYSAMVPYSLFSVDEASKWDRLAAMMPYSTFDLVVSKYLMGFLCMGTALVMVLALQPLTAFLTGARRPAWGLALAALWTAVVVMDVTLPLVFRFGVEKARMTMLFLIAAVCGSAGALSYILGESVDFSIEMPLLVMGAASAVIATVVSVKISIGNYEKREW